MGFSCQEKSRNSPTRRVCETCVSMGDNHHHVMGHSEMSSLALRMASVNLMTAGIGTAMVSLGIRACCTNHGSFDHVTVFFRQGLSM